MTLLRQAMPTFTCDSDCENPHYFSSPCPSPSSTQCLPPGHSINSLIPDESNFLSSEDAENKTAEVKRYFESRFDPDCLFRDQKRPIDFIIAWEDDKSYRDINLKKIEKVKYVEIGNPAKNKKKQKQRETFLRNLQDIGIQIEEEIAIKHNLKCDVHFLKVYVPFDIMCHLAEKLNFKVPLKVHFDKDDPSRCGCLRAKEIPYSVPLFSTCLFRVSLLNKLPGINYGDKYFTIGQRQQIIYYILSNVSYGDKMKGQFGIDKLVAKGVFSAAYPLHETGFCRGQRVKDEKELNTRQILQKFWVTNVFNLNYHLNDHVREYFGDQIAFYQGFTAMYVRWLTVPSLLGIIMFSFGVLLMVQSVPLDEVCESNKNYYMCPICDDEGPECEPWYLSDKCSFMRCAAIFDAPHNAIFALLMSIWSVAFLKRWKRKSSFFAYQWGTFDLAKHLETPRPEYLAKCNSTAENPVTKIIEPSFDNKHAIRKKLIGYAPVGASTLMFLLWLIYSTTDNWSILGILAKIKLAPSYISLYNKYWLNAIFDAVIVTTLGSVNSVLANWLTEKEMYITQAKFNKQLTKKRFSFEFVNNFTPLIYIGMLKGKFVGYPGNYTYNIFFGERVEQCSYGTCLFELIIELFILLFLKQVFFVIGGLIVSMIKFVKKNMDEKLLQTVQKAIAETIKETTTNTDDCVSKKIKRWELDYRLRENAGLFDEYLGTVLQFGFITMFVAAFPPAPLVAFISNYIAIVYSNHTLMYKTKRPVSVRAKDMGVWFSFLNIIAHISVLSNAILLAFTSEVVPHLLYMSTHNWSMKGYTNFSLAWSPVDLSQNSSSNVICRYISFRDKSGALTEFFWKLLSFRFLFIIIFTQFVLAVSKLLDYFVADEPYELNIRIEREKYLAKQAMADAGIGSVPYVRRDQRSSHQHLAKSDKSSNKKHGNSAGKLEATDKMGKSGKINNDKICREDDTEVNIKNKDRKNNKKENRKNNKKENTSSKRNKESTKGEQIKTEESKKHNDEVEDGRKANKKQRKQKNKNKK